MRSIRPANLGDLPEIANLELGAFGQSGHTSLSLRQLFDLFPSLFLVAASGSSQPEAIGYSVGAISQLNSVGWILALTSRADCRRVGVGRSLTEELIARLQNHGVDETFLTVAPQNLPARSLYLQLGFRERVTVADYFVDNEPRLLMSRNRKT